MKREISSALSLKRIVITLILFFLVPVIQCVIYTLNPNETLSYMFALNLVGAVMMIYNWNLFALHYNRAKKNPGDTLIYTLIGCVFIGLWAWFNSSILRGNVLLPDPAVLKNNIFAAPAVFAAYTVIQAEIVSMSFKCLTDHMKIHSREVIIILVSGFAFGLLYTIAFTPLIPEQFIPAYFFNTILVSMLSYLYNQSGNFISGMLAWSIVLSVLIAVSL